ncbi:hypothetical protein M2282_005960 [Variovorax boronicumulans]|nr:hypothetical protein [Variovorax boronicumulans]
MAVRSLNSSSVVRESYKDWTLHARWYASWAFTSEGWVCKLLPPGVEDTSKAVSTSRRYRTSAEALTAGRAKVDFQLAAAARRR